MRNYMNRQVTPPKRVTPPTWGPPPPCKRTLSGLNLEKCRGFFPQGKAKQTVRYNEVSVKRGLQFPKVLQDEMKNKSPFLFSFSMGNKSLQVFYDPHERSDAHTTIKTCLSFANTSR